MAPYPHSEQKRVIEESAEASKPRHPDGGSCATCKWSVQLADGQIECHGAPPTAHMTQQTLQHKITQQVQIVQTKFSMWPQVPPDWWCRAFEAGVEVETGGGE